MHVLPEEVLRAQQEAMRSNSLQQFHPLQEVEIPYSEMNLQNMSSNLNPRADCFYPTLTNQLVGNQNAMFGTSFEQFRQSMPE